jgi:hypothetical protein
MTGTHSNRLFRRECPAGGVSPRMMQAVLREHEVCNLIRCKSRWPRLVECALPRIEIPTQRWSTRHKGNPTYWCQVPPTGSGKRLLNESPSTGQARRWITLAKSKRWTPAINGIGWVIQNLPDCGNGSQVVKQGKHRYMRVVYEDGDEGWYFRTAEAFARAHRLAARSAAHFDRPATPAAYSPTESHAGARMLPRAAKKKSGSSARSPVRVLRS